jgi:hypothetical protein
MRRPTGIASARRHPINALYASAAALKPRLRLPCERFTPALADNPCITQRPVRFAAFSPSILASGSLRFEQAEHA